MKFLEQLAEKLINSHGNDFSHVIVVLPSLRARHSLRRALKKKIRAVFWLPEMIILPDLVERVSGKKAVSGLQLLLSLYEAYCSAVTNPDDFSTFSSWAPVVLKDFQDIEQYMVDPASLFINLRNIEQVEKWSLGNQNLSASQEKYLGFWNDTRTTYEAFQSLQKERDTWSYGALVRQSATLKSATVEDFSKKTIWIAGITSLTPAEEKFVDVLSQHCTLHIAWDADSYYVKDVMNEAGTYLRKWIKNRHEEIPLSNDLSQNNRTVVVYETSTALGEVLALAEVLKQTPADELRNSAIVLADNSLAGALLQSLPKLDVPFHTGIGLPLKNTNLGKWVGILLQLRSPSRKGKIHFHTFLDWISLSRELGLGDEAQVAIRNEIIREVIIYPGLEKCLSLIRVHAPDATWSGLMEKNLNPQAFLLQLRGVIESYLEKSDDDVLRKSASIHLVKVVDELVLLLGTHSFTNSFEILQVLWNQLISKEEIQFASEPGDGISILSMVEARALDFKKLFILGANEESFPGTSQEQTFIPWDLRHIFKMPLPDEREAAFAYNFYRLLQRTDEVHFFYSALSADYKASEPSRFITQLEYEWPLRNKNVVWSKKTIRSVSPQKTGSTHAFPNNDFVKARLDTLFSSGLSPSAMGKFNRCPLDFYYRYIIGLGEQEEIEEQVSAATFGSVLHDVLEHFYNQYKGSFPSEKDFLELIDNAEIRLREAFQKLYSSTSISSGYNLLAMNVAEEMLRKYLANEMRRAASLKKDGLHPIVRDIEFWMERNVDTSKYDWPKPVKLRGKGDRLEEIAGKLYIIDYKTGKVHPEDYQLTASMEEIISSAKGGKLLQLMTYIYMYCGERSAPQNVTAGFYSFVKASSGYSFLQEKSGEISDNGWIGDFEKSITEWVRNVYELKTFEHDPDSRFCRYCQN